MRYAHTICRVADAVIHVVKLLRGDLTALVSLSISLLALYEAVRDWLGEAAERVNPQRLESLSLEAA